jgi:branched-chain amino acid transport system ATP-binding protein
LEVKELALHFGGVTAVGCADLVVEPGSITGLIGPNGAGKTSLFNCISRLYQASSGSIVFDGLEISSLHPHRIRNLGIARTFQNISLLSEYSVLENILVGGHVRGPAGFVSSLLTWRSAHEGALEAEARRWAEQLDLTDVLAELPGDLPYGTQKRVELARALMGAPRLLLADEPATGLTHAEVHAFGETLRAVAADLCMSVLLVEHHMGLVHQICDRVTVMSGGRVIARGTPQEVSVDAAVVEAYLGATAGEVLT